ncbi:MAG: hypothetical protein BJ554DRAFT_202, partial [Olpidium bornovanus]
LPNEVVRRVETHVAARDRSSRARAQLNRTRAISTAGVPTPRSSAPAASASSFAAAGRSASSYATSSSASKFENSARPVVILARAPPASNLTPLLSTTPTRSTNRAQSHQSCPGAPLWDPFVRPVDIGGAGVRGPPGATHVGLVSWRSNKLGAVDTRGRRARRRLRRSPPPRRTSAVLPARPCRVGTTGAPTVNAPSAGNGLGVAPSTRDSAGSLGAPPMPPSARTPTDFSPASAAPSPSWPSRLLALVIPPNRFRRHWYHTATEDEYINVASAQQVQKYAETRNALTEDDKNDHFKVEELIRQRPGVNWKDIPLDLNIGRGIDDITDAQLNKLT